MINHYAITPEQSGGTRHFSFAKRLIDRGHRVVVIASNYDHFNQGHRHDGLVSPRMEEVHGVPYLWLPSRAYVGNGRGRALNMLDFARGLCRIASLPGLPRPDLVFGSSPHLFAPFSAQRLARRLGVPFVLEIRDVWPQTLVDLGNFSPRHPMIRVLAAMECRLYRTADHIVSLLPGAVDHCVALGADRDRVTWVPNGVDLDLVPEGAQREHNAGDFTLMFAGAHGLANGLDTILDAAARTRGRGIRYQLIGDGPEKPRLIQRANEERLDHVEFLDPVPKQQVYSVLARADAFLMLLKASDVFRWGISPNKLFDYMCMERPVIFGVNSSNSPVEQAGCGLRIPPEDPEALAAAALHLAGLPDEDLAVMGKAGRAYVESNHDFDRLAERLEDVFLKVVRKR